MRFGFFLNNTYLEESSENAQLAKYLPQKCEDQSSISSTHLKKPDFTPVEKGWGQAELANLTHLVGSRPVRDLVSKTMGDDVLRNEICG